MNKERCHNDCCKIPVCLEFTSVIATDEFKEQMTELFTEIFEDLCNEHGHSHGHKEENKNTKNKK
jgi:hypothetical protein